MPPRFLPTVTLMAGAITLATTPVYARRHHNAGGVEAEGRYSVVFPTSAALPDRNLTPGALSPDVTQDNLDETYKRYVGPVPDDRR
jgi:hypothetical protein